MAVYPIAGGYVDYSSTGTSKFIPQIWSGKLQEKFYKTTVFGEISNTKYEGEVKGHGDTVIIRTRPTIDIHNYSAGGSLIRQRPEQANITMTLDKGKYFNYECDDVFKAQADINFMEEFSNDASMQLKIEIDKDVLNGVYVDAHASNKGATAGLVSSSYNLGVAGTPFQITAASVLGKVIDCGSVLTEQNVPEDGRWMVIPEQFANVLLNSEIKNVSLTGDGLSPLRNGNIGKLRNFTLYVSNNYTSVADSGGETCYNVIFGHPVAISFASQLTKMRTLENPDSFGQLVSGLMTYGYKTTVPAGLGVLYCYF